MQINLLNITACEGKVIEVPVSFELNEIEMREESYPITNKEPLVLRIENTGNKVLKVQGHSSISVTLPCDRCLCDVSVMIPIEIDRELDMKLTDEERINDLDESSYLTGMDLDVDRLIYLEVLMAWPLKVLCNEDCKGFCSNCGTNLNEGSCKCDDLPRDPRMAAISDIFSKFNKEV
ncbi:MAG: DUF177 domain-containing protein [Eubacteriales bacterium]|nr:DUF177 domain-containing protein [Eubacteriales bacterium]